jgi:hypothetical protein
MDWTAEARSGYPRARDTAWISKGEKGDNGEEPWPDCDLPITADNTNGTVAVGLPWGPRGLA